MLCYTPTEGSHQPEQLQQEDVDMESQERPSYEGLLERVKTLETTVEGLTQSLAKKEEKIKKQAKAFKDMRRMFSKSKWEYLTKQHEQRKVMLAESLKLEGELSGTVEGLKEGMGRVSGQVREKEEEVRKLAKKVSRLRERDEQRKSVNLKKRPEEEDAKTMLMQQGDGAGGETTTCPRIAAAILPEEVWRMILGNLSDPKELWDCCNTCQLFETILRPWKTGWMLEQALPHLYKHLPGRKLLECRQVSKGWNAGVNNFLQNHPSTQPCKADRDPRDMDEVYPVKEKGIGNRNVFNFGPDEDLSVLEELFSKNLGRNPFIGRYVIFHLRKPNGLEDTLEVEEQRWAKMYTFLESYGKEIWNLSLYFPLGTGRRTTDRIIELMTSKLFPLVPNLRKLFITGTGCDSDIVDPEELPPAPNLKTLQVGRIGLDGIVDALLLRYHLQLEALHLDEVGWELVNDLECPNLKELVFCFYEEAIDLETLFAPRMPQLNRLILSLEEFDRLNLLKLLEAIIELSDGTSLNSFRLFGPFEEIEFEQLGANYFVPESLKTLELIDPWGGGAMALPSHNFLRYFPFIENLVIIIRKKSWGSSEKKYKTEIDMMPEAECRKRAALMEREDEVVEVNKYLYDGQMYKSNVWELLPRLKVLTFQWEVYTRENYEAYAKHRASSTSGEGSVE